MLYKEYYQGLANAFHIPPPPPKKKWFQVIVGFFQNIW